MAVQHPHSPTAAVTHKAGLRLRASDSSCRTQQVPGGTEKQVSPCLFPRTAPTLSRISIKQTSPRAVGDIRSTILYLQRKPQGSPVQWADQGKRLTEGECEGIKRCALYGKGGSRIHFWASPKGKPCEYPDLLKRCPQRSYSGTLY